MGECDVLCGLMGAAQSHYVLRLAQKGRAPTVSIRVVPMNTCGKKGGVCRKVGAAEGRKGWGGWGWLGVGGSMHTRYPHESHASPARGYVPWCPGCRGCA